MNRKEDIEWLKANNLIDDLTSMYIVKFRLQKMDEFRSIDNYYNSDKMRNFVAMDYTEEEFDRGYLYEWVYNVSTRPDKKDGYVYVSQGYVYRIAQYHGIRSYHFVDKKTKLSREIFEPYIYRSMAEIESKFVIKKIFDDNDLNYIIIGDN